MNQDLPQSPGDVSPLLAPEPLSPDESDEIDAILDELRGRYDETPQWEFCDGFMAALICRRRGILPSEYLPVLLAIGEEGAEDEGSFADAIWAVYDLRELCRSIGPRVETVHKVATPRRNDPCFCGSGKKYKKCHGA